jgi:hypothetical protein
VPLSIDNYSRQIPSTNFDHTGNLQFDSAFSVKHLFNTQDGEFGLCTSTLHHKLLTGALQAPKKVKVQETPANVALGPQAAEGENVFGVAHIFAS